MHPTIQLTQQLIACPSVTPYDAGCQHILAQRLEAIGFVVQHLRFGEVDNFWAVHGNSGPLLAFVGHTDVVPPGPLAQWSSPPFQPEIREGYLYGRGAADMKGSIAAMLIACERFIAANPQHKGRIAFLITSDEEGPSVDGTVKVVEWLQQQGETIDWCIVGEPSSEEKLGDIIKNGRRGTLSGILKVYGIQGHIAYPHKADNPIHKALPALAELIASVWDNGNEYFEPTRLQISNIHAGTGAGNVIPGELELMFNFRYSSALTAKELQTRVHALLDSYGLRYDLQWRHSGKPFLTATGNLLNACSHSLQSLLGITPKLSTHGGTSDGRFVAEMGAEIIELGPNNATIHKIDECVSVRELEQLTEVYERILQELPFEEARPSTCFACSG